MEDAPSFRNPFRTLKIQWRPEGVDTGSSLDACLGDVLLATVDKLTEMVRLLKCMLAEGTGDAEKNTCRILAIEVHKQEIVVTKCLLTSAIAGKLTNDIMRFPYRLERIGDMLENVLSCFERKSREGIRFSVAAQEELELLFSALLVILEDLRKTFVEVDTERLKSLIDQEKELRESLACYRQAHWERLWSGACLPQASSLYLDILDSIKWANEYLRKISMTLLEHETTA